MKIDREYLLDVSKEILSIDSPSGFTAEAIKRIELEIQKFGFSTTITNKGNLIVDVPGNSKKTLGISVHVDTLGLMVRSISNQTLKVTNIGGPIIPTLDSEYCKIYTRNGKIYTGTILSTSPAVHVYPDASKKERTIDNIEIRIDEVINTKEDIEKLGIQNGDFVCYDTKTTITESGFIKSRFLDDKINVGSLLTYLKYLKDNNITPKQNLKIIFSTHEEVGHGASHIPELDELLAVDMGCIGLDLSCTEYDVSICAKDSSGPYNYEFTNSLIDLARNNNLDYAVDIYPMYGSDASAALRAGHDVKTALIGPGVHASHGMERTHLKALENTIKLIILYTT